VHTKNPQHGSPDSGPVAAQPARATMATASSAMNDHRTLSPISQHPHLTTPDQISESGRPAPNSTLIAEIRPAPSPPQDRLAVWRSRGRSARRPSPCRSSLRGVDGSARQRTKSTVLGPELEPIRLNYCWFFLVFSLADDVVDPIKEGEGGE
jgi:hypothetical protein